MVAQVGLVYINVMLLILVVGLGVIGIRLVDWVVHKLNTPKTAEQNQKDLIRVMVFSVVLLLLSFYSLGVVQVMGIGGGSHH